jgi:protocatechuate 3,4-dioxygenase beta subunit
VPPPFQPLPPRPGIALGLAIVAVLAAYAEIRIRARHSTVPDPPTAQIDAATAARAGQGILPGTRRLEGKVIDEKNRPIGGARVLLNGARVTVSGPDGSFAFDALAPGDYALIGDQGQAHGEKEIGLDDGTAPTELTLHTGPTLVVHVVDQTGAAVVGVRVHKLDNLDAFTDRDGKVTFRSPSGHAYVTVVAPGYATSMLALILDDDPRNTVDRTIVLGPTAPIGGVVIDQDGAPLPGAIIKVEELDDSWTANATADDQGRWRLDGFGAGRLRLTATSDDARTTWAPSVAFDARAPRFDLVIRMDRGVTIGGVVVDDDGRPVAGAMVMAHDRSASSNLLSARADDRGRFAIAGASPGEATVTAYAETLASVPRTVEVPRTGRVDVTLRALVSGISGTITNQQGAPVANATVYAVGPGFGSASSDATGRFTVHYAGLGAYAVSVTRDSASDRGLGLADKHAVPAHTGDTNVALVLPDTARITGRLVLHGRPVAFFGVAADPTLTPEIQPASDGRFEIEVQPSTEWPEQRYLAFVGPDFQRRVLDGGVFAGPGQTTELGDIEVTAGKTMRGRIVTASGAPVAGAAVVVQTGDDLETELSLSKQNTGSRGARSDASGRFEITGLPDDLAELQIQAQHPELGMALPRALTLPDLAGGVVLVLAETGAVSGRVLGDAPGQYHRIDVRSRADGRLYLASTLDDAFRFAQLPVGDYTASLDGDDGRPATPFHVAAHRTTEISVR